MEFVRSLRTVLNHDVREKLKDDRGRLRGVEAKQEDEDIEQKGTMSRKTFEKIFQRSDQVNFSADQVWHFLIQLGLAIPILGKEEEPRILVPSLISDKTRDTMMKRAKEQDDTITLQYTFDWNYKSLQSFDDLVVIFTRLFFKEGGEGEIAQCFSQKIEKRTLGCVAGVYGKFTVPQTSEDLSFTVLQYDEASGGDSFESMQRLLRIKLKCISFSAVVVLRTLDEAFSKKYAEVERGLPCQECEEEGERGKIIRLDEGLRPQKHKDYCDGLARHNLTPELKTLLTLSGDSNVST